MTPLQIAEKYKTQICRSGYIQRRVTYKLSGNHFTKKEAEALAKEAIWLSATENPKDPVPNILHKAKKLYSKWLREDYLPIFAEMALKKRNPDKCFRLDDPQDQIVWPQDKAELSSEVYHCLDTLIRTCGIHLGLWAILSFALQDTQTKSQTIFKHMGMKPTKKQQKTASLVIDKLKTLLR